MAGKHNRDLVASYYRSLNARDWQAFKRTLAEDVIYEISQTGERVRGLEPYLDFNATFPGDWTLEVIRLVADDAGAAGQITFCVGGQEMTGISFFEIEDGKIAHITDFWPEPYEPPKRASKWVERY
jgi:ketosteroid isomerase-like protein